MYDAVQATFLLGGSSERLTTGIAVTRRRTSLIFCLRSGEEVVDVARD